MGLSGSILPIYHSLISRDEIGITPDDAIRLGYTNDVYQNPITSGSQVIELKCQDIIITEYCANYFMRVAKFVDDELEYLYNQPRFYNIKEQRDFIGVYFAGLAPHTSAAIAEDVTDSVK